MARLKSQANLQYIPTQDRIRPIIGSYLSFPDKETTILDPCCGTGAAVRDICPKDHYYFGLELHTGRALKAKKGFAKVLVGPLENAAISHGAFGFIHLNPPYDWVAGGEQRYEETFLYRCTNYLAYRGVLEYIVPTKLFEYRGQEILRYLLSNYRDLRVFKYPDPEYQEYKQLVFFGYRRTRQVISVTAEWLNEKIKAILSGDIPELESQSEPLYEIPVVSTGVLKKFFISYYDADLAQYDSQTTSILQDQSKLAIKDHLTAPFLLDKALLAVLSVGGYMDGSMPGHYLLGKYDNHEEKEVVVNDDGDEVEVTTKKSTTVFYALCKQPGANGSRIAEIR